MRTLIITAMLIIMATVVSAQELMPQPPGTEMVDVVRPTKKAKKAKKQKLKKKHESGYEKLAITRQQ